MSLKIKKKAKTTCKTDKCNERAYYGYVYREYIACTKHKSADMIHVKNKLCSCGSQMHFGFPTDSEPSRCKKCKSDDMINIISKKCECGSGIRPAYGIISDIVPVNCSKCKTNDMVNIISKKCDCGSGINPVFGLQNDITPTFCSKCKTNEMINVKNKKKCKCGLAQPNFGLPDDKKPTCCAKCKDDNMINIVSIKCPCGNRVVYGFKTDDKPTCCLDCKKEDMINMCINKCIAVDINGEKYCDTKGNKKYDGYCTHCFAHIFPLDSRTQNIYKNSKEIVVRDYINKLFDGFQHDKPLWTGGCDCTHRRRIDHRKLMNGTLLAIGTDEYQHKSYDKNDEIIRYDDLMMVHGGKFIYIRFNPDSYRKNGVLKDPPMEERLESLKKEIEKQIKRIKNDENNELMEIIHMYYNC
jgi:hypothetical protein